MCLDLLARWREERLQNIAELRTSNVDKKSVEDEQPVRLCNYVDVYKNDKITMILDFMTVTASEAQTYRFNLRVDDVVITKDSESPDDIGIPALVVETSPDLVCGYHLTILRPYKDKAVGSYLAYALCSRLSAYQFYLAANGVTRFGLTYQGTKNIRIALPPPDEQRRIAAFLDWKTGQIDALIARKQALLEMLKEKRLAVITQAVSRGLNPVAPLRDSDIPWLDKVPEHWGTRRLKFTVTLRNEKMDAEESTLDYMGLEHIESWTGNRIEDESASSEGITTRFLEDDVLFGKLRPYLAKVYLAEKEGMATTEALILTSDAVLFPKFLKYLLISEKFIDIVSGTTYGSKMPRANWRTIGSIPIPLPSRNEQQQITAFLDSETTKLSALEAKVLDVIEKLQEYRTALITATTTGKIDVRNTLTNTNIKTIN